MATTTAELKDEFRARGAAANLHMQCLMDGPFHAEIAVVGEAPGEREAEVGRPLVGTSGSKLWEIARKFGISRNNIYTTNVSKRIVSFGNDKRHPINKHEKEIWHTLLQWELSQLPNLKYVILLGNMALEALTGRSGITNWRGSVLLKQPIPHTDRIVDYVCMFNPAAVVRDPKLELTFTFDCAKVAKVIKDDWVITPVNTLINPTVREVFDYFDKMNTNDELIAHDIESINNETACIGFANGPNDAICINFRNPEKEDGNQFSAQDERIVRKRIQYEYKRNAHRLAVQNNMFDAGWLLFKDKIQASRIRVDTMLAHHTLYPTLPHNLGYLTSQYTTRPYYKNEKDEWREKNSSIEDFWRYNGQDACNTWIAANKVIAELKEAQLYDFFMNHVMALQPYLIQMSVGGCLVDVSRKQSFMDTIGKEVETRKEAFLHAARTALEDPDYECNPNSPTQLAELFFHKLKLVGRGTSTDEENRKRMYAHPATSEAKRTVLRAVDAYKEEHKFYSTYATSAIDDDDRIRCSWNQTGVQAAPGRLSSSGMLWRNAAGEQTGMNMQNQPERAYELYIADPGYGLGYFDMAQAEARIVGCYANITSWIEQFERARIDGVYDAHRALASEMFRMPYDEVPTFDRYDASKGHLIPDGKRDRDVTVRFIAKRCRHGLNYRMMPDRLATTTGLTVAEATVAYNTYHRITPELQRWWQALEEEVRRTKTLYNAYGRRFIILERLSPEALESIVAFKPQSTLGDHVSGVIRKSQEDPRWPSKARMWLNIHDALICLAPTWALQRCISIMKKYAEQPIPINGHNLIIPADTKISYPKDDGIHRWSTFKPIQIEAAK